MTPMIASGMLTFITFMAIAAFAVLAFLSMRKQIRKTDVPFEDELRKG